jgi:arylformamidase
MHIYDISLTISPELPIWPGDPAVKLERFEKLEEGSNANVSRVYMGVHTGTHIDAPYHFLQDGRTVEEMKLSMMVGRVYVLHLPDIALIDSRVLEMAQIPPRTRRILFRTRNSDLWREQETDFQTNFVAISADGADYLVKRGIKLVGVDYLSVAPYGESRLPHQILLKAGIVILEGLDLSKVSQGRYSIYCLPLKLAGSDGAPTRAILIGV